MPASAVAITPERWLTDIDLGNPDLRLAHLRRLPDLRGTAGSDTPASQL
jgi:hypothetical protein